MKILLVHNRYQQLGGEDTILATEADLLKSYGHEVHLYQEDNHKIADMNPLALTKATLWNGQSYRNLQKLIRQMQPEIVHFHNTFPLISPSAYYAVRDLGIPVVQTIHNFRLFCANALFFRDGRVCEDCLQQKNPLPGIINACYRDSFTATTAATAMVEFHKLLGTWHKAIDVFIAYSNFAHAKLIEGGLSPEKISFKTNFLYPTPEVGSGAGKYALFVGRISPEKGTETLLNTWRKLDGRLPLKVVGDGPIAPQLAAMAKEIPGVEWLGRKPLAEVYQLMGNAAFLVIPSEWYETFGRVAIEALAKGTPLLVSNIGALAELVEPYHNGLTFEPGNESDLREQVTWLLDNPDKLQQMRHGARQSFEANYRATDNYQRLMEIYQQAINQKNQQLAVSLT